MTPADSLLQNLEQGPISYTDNEYDKLGRDVRDAARACLANKHITEEVVSEVVEQEAPEEGAEAKPPLSMKRVTWTILPAGIERMSLLREPEG